MIKNKIPDIEKSKYYHKDRVDLKNIRDAMGIDFVDAT